MHVCLLWRACKHTCFVSFQNMLFAERDRESENLVSALEGVKQLMQEMKRVQHCQPDTISPHELRQRQPLPITRACRCQRKRNVL